MSLNIRTAEPADLPVILAVDRECFPEGREDLQPAPSGEIERGVATNKILLAELAGQPVGFLQHELSEIADLEVLSLAITAEARGHGVGNALLTHFLNSVGGQSSIWCVTAPTNLAMRALLEKHGFVLSRSLPDYFGPGRHRVGYLRKW